MSRVSPPDETEEEDAYYREVGRRLREIRERQGLSMHAVQAKSGGRWKQPVIGSYERYGQRDAEDRQTGRIPSLWRLVGLSRFYGVPLDALIPGLEGSDVPLGEVLVVLHRAGEVKAASDALGRDCDALRAAIEAAVQHGSVHDGEAVKAGDGDE